MKRRAAQYFFLILLLCYGKESFSQMWKELNDSLISSYKEGDYNKALFFAEKAKKAAQSEFGETHINYNKSLTNLAIVYDRKGMLSEAEGVRIRSAEISKIIFGENSLECATAFNQLGLLYEKLKNIKKAESNYLLSISILRKQNPLDELLISVLYNLADFYEANDLVVKAIETYEQWEKTIEVIKGDSYTVSPSGLTSFAILYKNTGQYKKAEPLFYRANEILKKTVGAEHPDYASSLSNLAGLYKDIGLYEKAEPLYIESTAIRKKTVGENHPDYARGLNNMAVLYDLMGQYENAKMLYVQAIEIRKKTLGENHPDYAYSLINLAATLDNMGEKEQSEQFLLQAREIIKKTLGERHPSYSTCLNNLGGLYKKVGEFKKAEMLYNEAKEIRKTVLGENHTDYASSLSNLAILYTNLGEYKKAEPLFIQAKKIREKAFGEKHPEYANSLSNLAMLYLTTGQYEDAQMLFSEGSKIETTNLLSVFTNLSEREKGNFLTNNFFLNSSTNSLVYNYRKASPDFYLGNNNLQLFLKSLSLASTKNTLDAARNSSDTTVQKVLINWQENKSILSKQFSLPVANRREDLKQIEEQTESLEKELTRRSSAFKNQQQVLQIKTTDVHKSLKENEVAIEFVRFQLYTKNWTDSMMYAAYILRKNDPAPMFVPLCEEKQLQKIFDSAGTTATSMVSKFYRGLEIISNNKSWLGHDLYKLIWAPLEPYLKGIKKISYSPAGKSHSIAFHALTVDSSTLLMDKYELQQYTSTRQVALRTSEKQNAKPTNITLFGDASFTMDSLQLVKQKKNNDNISTTIYTLQKRNSNNSSWVDLPGTAEEVKKIKKLFDENTIENKLFVKTEATEENLKALDGNSPQILHIATHGFFLPEVDNKRKENNFNNENTYTLVDDPLLRSGLILSGGNYGWSGKTPIDGVEDGIATAYEISQLNLSNTELVVLSACETALGDVKGSEGVFGLQRAFKMAGVKKMIVSLWQVPDKETAELMITFYTYWMSGKTINESFTQAQADMRKKYSPFYWAAFVLVE